MSKEQCVLELIATGINFGVAFGTIEKGLDPIDEKCAYCIEETRCDCYMPLIRIQNVRTGEVLYRRNYNKKDNFNDFGDGI